ncbi:MAG: deoxyribodipyrimidine photo-lyase [Nitriliruptoraceae bacterium]
MTTAIVLFTRDLRVHDHPALVAACARADRVYPLFVFDEAILAGRYAAPNRLSQLVDAVADLRDTLEARGGRLLVRRGDPMEVVRSLAVEVAADEVHLSADVSRFARRREAALRAMARDELSGRLAVHTHDGVTVHPAGAVTPTGGDHFKVFTPYWRRWDAEPHRQPLAPPTRVPTPAATAHGGPTAGATAGSSDRPTGGPEDGRIPALGELTDVAHLAPDLPRGGEVAARERAAWWFAGPVGTYDDSRDQLAADGTARLSHHLHLGTISATELAAGVDRAEPGQEAFLRQLCWRDFNHQLLAARGGLVESDLRPRGDRWRDDEEAIAAWKDGRTGYPVVDAGMRQLRREGWMHNRARMIVASFLTKHLYVDWRVGAWHFMDHLVDGDLANNFAQWQWAAGTGMDSRPNRMFNPVVQSRRFDADGAYIRRYVPELAEVDDAQLHAPWEADGTLLGVDTGYPPPLVDHREARARFLEARGA